MIPLLMLVLSAFAQEPDREDPVDERITVEERRSDYQVVQIYVDLSEVIAPDGYKGTSMPLNVLISHHAQGSYLLRRRMQYWSNPYRCKGEVNIYDWSNVQHMPTFSDCDYGDAVKCGIKNRHWTLRTVVSVGKKYSVLTQKLYDENGKIITNSAQTAWGKIRWKQHLRTLKGKCNPNHKLQEDYDKFGEEVFEWSVLKELPKNKDTLLLEEIKMIDKLMKEGKGLYNLSLTIDQLQMLQEDK